MPKQFNCLCVINLFVHSRYQHPKRQGIEESIPYLPRSYSHCLKRKNESLFDSCFLCILEHEFQSHTTKNIEDESFVSSFICNKISFD